MEPMRDPIMIATWLSLGVCMARSLCLVGSTKPVACARCGNDVERSDVRDSVCTCLHSR